MSIERLVEHYESTCAQIKNHRESISALLKRKQSVEDEIMAVLERMETDGITTGGIEVFIERKLKKARMSKKQKEEEYIRVLKENNIQNPNIVYSALNEVGERHEKSTVKMRGAARKK